jgi:hypothetical protein
LLPRHGLPVGVGVALGIAVGVGDGVGFFVGRGVGVNVGVGAGLGVRSPSGATDDELLLVLQAAAKTTAPITQPAYSERRTVVLKDPSSSQQEIGCYGSDEACVGLRGRAEHGRTSLAGRCAAFFAASLGP